MVWAVTVRVGSWVTGWGLEVRVGSKALWDKTRSF